MGRLLFLALIAVPIIRHITHGERLWLIRINTNSLRYMLSQFPVILILVGIAVFALMATAAFGGVLHKHPGRIWCNDASAVVPRHDHACLSSAFRLALVPVAAVASGSLNFGHGLALTKKQRLSFSSDHLMIGIPLLIVGLIAMDAVLQLYMTDQDSLAAVCEPNASHIFNGGPRQILELYVYIFSKPSFIAANTIVFLFLAFAAGSMLSAPAIAYRKLTRSVRLDRA